MSAAAHTPHPVVLVILDGLADRFYPELDMRTPLEAARTPNLDAFAARGLTGLLHPLGCGRAPGSELAHMVLFGYPAELFPGRSVFEAAGDDFDLSCDDVAFRALFSTVRREPDGSLTLVEHFAEADDAVCARLAADLPVVEHEGLTVRLHFTRKRQGMLLVSGGASVEVTDCDPFFRGEPVAAILPLAHAGEPEHAERTASAVTRWLREAYATLAAHPANRALEAAGANPANFVLAKWTGRRRALPPFERLTGMRGASVHSWSLFTGLARELGMHAAQSPHLEDDPAEELLGRLRIAADLLGEGYDFVHVHSKAPDEAGHRKDPAVKRDAIERLDAAVGELAGILPPDALVVVTGDHGTPASTRLIHSGDPVPLAVVGPPCAPDRVTEFGERACAGGFLGQMEGRDLMPALLNLRGTTRYLGARLAPDAELHWPPDYERFRA